MILCLDRLQSPVEMNPHQAARFDVIEDRCYGLNRVPTLPNSCIEVLTPSISEYDLV